MDEKEDDDQMGRVLSLFEEFRMFRKEVADLRIRAEL